MTFRCLACEGRTVLPVEHNSGWRCGRCHATYFNANGGVGPPEWRLSPADNPITTMGNQQDHDLPSRARARSTPNKITPEVLAGICKHIAQGEARNMACARYGVSDSALRKLRAEHPEVDEQVAVAEAEGARHYLAKIAECPAGKDAADDWKRWAWIGERLHPSVFKPPAQAVESSGPNGEPQKHEVRVDAVDRLSGDELVAAARAILGKDSPK